MVTVCAAVVGLLVGIVLTVRRPRRGQGLLTAVARGTTSSASRWYAGACRRWPTPRPRSGCWSASLRSNGGRLRHRARGQRRGAGRVLAAADGIRPARDSGRRGGRHLRHRCRPLDARTGRRRRARGRADLAVLDAGISAGRRPRRRTRGPAAGILWTLPGLLYLAAYTLRRSAAAPRAA